MRVESLLTPGFHFSQKEPQCPWESLQRIWNQEPQEMCKTRRWNSFPPWGWDLVWEWYITESLFPSHIGNSYKDGDRSWREFWGVWRKRRKHKPKRILSHFNTGGGVWLESCNISLELSGTLCSEDKYHWGSVWANEDLRIFRIQTLSLSSLGLWFLLCGQLDSDSLEAKAESWREERGKESGLLSLVLGL